MGTDTCFRVWRKYNTKDAALAEYDALKEEYRLKNEKDDWREDKASRASEHAKDIPILLERGFKAERGFTEECDSHVREAIGKDDGKLYVMLLEYFFGRSLGKLRDYYNLNPGQLSRMTAFVPEADIKKIVQAAKYLLRGVFSKDDEDILDNEFISILGDNYPKWYLRSRRDSEKIYIDKNDDEGYVVSFGDHDYDAECEEENRSTEQILKKLVVALQSVLDAEKSYDGKDELVLEICAF